MKLAAPVVGVVYIALAQKAFGPNTLYELSRVYQQPHNLVPQPQIRAPSKHGPSKRWDASSINADSEY